ncbi:MAG: ATP-binding protein [Gammaproteobacteria bacterium]|nr:ATP-binding protein [Gammaproteobacteria bacterium]
MSMNMSDITLHIDENTSHNDREELRDSILSMPGVMAADCHDNQPHLMIIEYDPERINSSEFLAAVKQKGLHAELIGL